MAEQEKPNLYREKVLKRISAPEQLSDYLRVTNPSVWMVLVVILLLLAGLFVWAANATIETTVSTKVSFSDGIGSVETRGLGEISINQGDMIRIGNRTLSIDMVNTDETGHVYAYVLYDMPDGTYDATVVMTADHPLDFLFAQR